MSYILVFFALEPLTHRFLDDVTSINPLVLIHLLKLDENPIPSTDPSLGTHQSMIWAGDPSNVPSTAVEVSGAMISLVSCIHDMSQPRIPHPDI